MHQLTVLVALSRHMPDFWTRDAEMMAVAIMSDPSRSFGKGKEREGTLPVWGEARVGQSIILLEVISRIRRARLAKKETTAVRFFFLTLYIVLMFNMVSKVDQSHAALIKFVTGLETRLAILFEAKVRSIIFTPTKLLPTLIMSC